MAAVVRQTTVLLAQLATAGGERRQLVHTANEVFLGLVDELKRQGLGTRVIADMFGLALRTYHDKVQRCSESRTFRGRSLWEAVLEYVEQKGPVFRTQVLERFRHDDATMVRSVLRDLMDSSLVYRTGQGEHSAYRAAPSEELPGRRAINDDERLATFVWVAISRQEPVGFDALCSVFTLEPDDVQRALTKLLADERIHKCAHDASLYECATNLVPYGEEVGWEAAVFDHYQAMVSALCTKLEARGRGRDTGDAVGGSTFRYDLWEGHPMQEEVMGFLQRTRAEGSALRERLAEHNRGRQISDDERIRVLAYVGQTVLRNEPSKMDDE
jgi:hypothetical protein